MDQRHFYQSRPPTCIAEFVARATPPPQIVLGQSDSEPCLSSLDVAFDDDVAIQSCFRLACHCGGTSHLVHGFHYREPGRHPLILSPLILECTNCGKCALAFDSEFHGYDAEQGTRTNRRGEGKLGVIECPHCGPNPLEVHVAFEYADDRFDGSQPQFAGREQDLFNSFTMYGTCVRCLRQLEVANFECD